MKAARGFTLLEAVIAVGLLAMLGGLTFGVFSRALAVRERATALTDRVHQVRQAMARMGREISMAFLSQAKDCADPRTQTLFHARSAGHGTRLDFTSFSHFKVQVDAKESDQNELSYFVEADAHDAGRRHLMRREQAPIDEHADEGGTTQVLAEDIDSLEFAFYDPKRDRWEEEWDTTGIDTRLRLPKFVEIKLMARDSHGKPQRYVTKTRIFLRDALAIPGTGQVPCIE